MKFIVCPFTIMVILTQMKRVLVSLFSPNDPNKSRNCLQRIFLVAFFPIFIIRRLTLVSLMLFLSCMLYVYQGACFFFKLFVNFEKMLSLFGSFKKAFSCALLMQIEMFLFLIAELVIILFECSL